MERHRKSGSDVKRITIREHGKIHLIKPGRRVGEDTLDDCWLGKEAFDRLQQYDRTREDSAVFDWRVDEARARHWVGVIQVPHAQVEIVPKIEGTHGPDATVLARDNLLVMLSEAGAVPLRVRDLAQLDTRRANLQECLIALFAKRLSAELLRGLDRGYLHEEDNIRALKGKLQISRHVAKNTARRDRFACAFQEFTSDTTLSRVLKATCRVLIRDARSKGAHDALGHCLALLDDVSDVQDARPLLEHVAFTRQNDRFEDLFGFCRLVLLQHSPTMAAGRQNVFSLLFNMDRIFEGFVTARLRRELSTPGSCIRIYPQAKTRRRYLMESPNGPVLSLKPDVLIESPDGNIIVDIKWKRLDINPRTHTFSLSSADLYQLYAYTRRYGVKRSIIMFPKVPGATEVAYHPLGPDGDPDKTTVSINFIDLSENLRVANSFVTHSQVSQADIP